MSSRKTIVGLDFGSFSIKAVWVEKRGATVRLLRSEELQLPPETQDPVRFISPWLEKHGILKNTCAIAIPGTQTVFQPVALAPADPRTAEQAAEMEVSAFNDMASENMRHGASTFEWTPGARQMLLALVRPGVVDRALRGADAFGLRLCELLPSPVAAFNASAPAHGPRPAPTLHICVGHATTDIAIGTSKGLLFARSFAVGGKAFTDALTKAGGLQPAQAERVKRTEAALTKGNPHAATLAPAGTLWFSQLRAALSVYRGQFTGESFAIGDVRLSGGGALLKGFAEFVGKQLDLPTSVSSDHVLPAIFATAYGLALSGAETGICGISFLPQRMRDEIVFGEKKPYWIAAGVCASLALAVFIVSGIRGIRRERAVVEAESARIKKLQQIDARVKEARKASDNLREFGQPLLSLLQSGPLARELVTLVANSINPDDWVTLICDEAVYLPPPPPDADTARGAQSLRNIRRPVTAALAAAPAAPRGRPVAGRGTAAKPAVSKGVGSPPLYTYFIIEGYTPSADLSSVKELVNKLRSVTNFVKHADVQADERVLPATTLGESPPDEFTRGMTRFVVRVEVIRP